MSPIIALFILYLILASILLFKIYMYQKSRIQSSSNNNVAPEPTPEEPLPEEPLPEEPLPEEPIPEEPLPEEPLPEEPLPDQPLPEEPLPDQPLPEEPVPEPVSEDPLGNTEFSASSTYCSKNVKVWLNAFIHNNIPGYSTTVNGVSMIPGPPFQDCFTTDQRGYSNNINASSRLHSELSVNFTSKTYSTKNTIGTTHQVDCDSPQTVYCSETATNKNMKFSSAYFSPDGKFFRIYIKASAGNPCVTGAPDIDYQGWFTIQYFSTYVKFAFLGKVDEFPFYESYGQLGSSTPVEIFKLNPTPGKTPFNLFGTANRPVDSSGYARC
jgi:hypothetical protein